MNATADRMVLEGISKSYGSVKALVDASMSVGRGEVVALLGENGAGKSTLVKVIAGLIQPDSGSMCLNGTEVRFSNSAAAQAHGVALVTQEFSLVPSMSVAENLVLGQVGSGLWWGRRKLRSNARRLLKIVGLERLDPSTPVELLGVAERQLIEIARGVGRDADLLILDEPTAALADDAIDRVLAVVQDLAKDGKSIIYVTHRLAEVTKISTRIQVVRNGETLPSVDTASTSMDSVVEMMLGRELVELFPKRQASSMQGDSVLVAQDLEAQDLAKPLSLTVRAGEVVGLTGQLGSGASAAMKAMAGVSDVTGGTLTVKGEEVPLRVRLQGLRRGIAYCSSDRQRDGVFLRLSVLENLSAPWLDQVANKGWVSRKDEKAKAIGVAEDFAIDPARFSGAAGTLSGGNQQKVALGKWLGIDPAVLLAEEPTRGVDIGARAEIYRRLRELADSGVAIVLCSTDTTEVLGLCDRILTFYRGEVTGDRPYSEWNDFEVARSVMHGKEGR